MSDSTCPECNSASIGFNPKKQLWVCKDCWHEWRRIGEAQVATSIVFKPFHPLKLFLSYGRDEYVVMV